MTNDFNCKVVLSTIMDKECLFRRLRPMTQMAMVVLISTAVICPLAFHLRTFASQESYSRNYHSVLDMT